MDLSVFCHELWSDDQAEKLLQPYWEKLEKEVATGTPDFLQPEFIDKYEPMCKLSDGYRDDLQRVARMVVKNPLLSRWAAMLRYGVYEATPKMPLNTIPPVDKLLGEDIGLFHLLIMISTLPLIKATHQRLGLPEHMLTDGAAWIGGACQPYELAHPGHRGGPLGGWLRLQVDGRLFRIGRLEYLIQTWQTELPAVYLHKKSAQLAVLARDRWYFNEAGFRVNPEKLPYTRVTHLTYQNNSVTGTPINVRGKVQFDKQLTLKLDEWEPLASAWDIVPSIHIPGGGGLTTEAVKDSLVKARDFFHRYLKIDVKAFGCSSWILNPAWEKELPDSNFAKLQRNVYLTVPEEAPISGLYFVYGSSDANPLTQPCTTHLHQAFRRIYQRHEPLTWGGMFVLARDFEKYGTEYYRKNYL